MGMSRKAWKASYPADIVRAAMTGAAAGAGKVEDVMRAKMAGMPGRGPWAGKSGNVVKAAKAGAPGEAAGPGAAEDTAGAGTAGNTAGAGTAGGAVDAGAAGNTAGAGTAGNAAGAGMSGAAGADGMQPCGVSAGRLQTDRKSAGYGSAKAEDAVRRTEGARRGMLAAEACRGIVWHEILGEPMCRRRRKR